MSIYSSSDQLQQILKVLSRYVRLPFSVDTIPGAIMEGVLAHSRGGQRLNTYDFVDVIDRNAGIGWQVKSTKATTPVTWKRAKIPNSLALISASRKSRDGCKALGDAIIAFCNRHAVESLETYKLKEIGYSRLIIHPNGRVQYFERLLCTRKAPQLFNADEFEWHWSAQKQTVKKEQLQALHGYAKATGKKWWAWHGLGENQLHFSGEREWWPPEGGAHSATFSFPTESEKMTVDAFLELLEKPARI